MGVLALAVVAVFASPAQEAGKVSLAKFIDKDLQKINWVDLADYRITLRQMTGEKEKKQWNNPQPWWVRAWPSGNVSWLALHVYPGYDIPDMGFLRTYTFDAKWRLLKRSEFPTGYRLRIQSVDITQEASIQVPLLRVKAGSVGPFIVTGKGNRPAFHPESGIVEHFAVTENGAALIRMADGYGHLLSNSYRWTAPSIGPNQAGRPVLYWQQALTSGNPVKQLECMVWLSGEHLTAKDWSTETTSREPVKSSKTYETIRNDPKVKVRLKALSNSSNAWVKEYALFTLRQLAKPVEVDLGP